jgi:hypothetical protein
MSREEDLIRSTTHAIASAVRDVPPLRLEQAPDELRAQARAPRRAHGGGGPRRRWWSWGAPLAAAAVVVALAISLVIVKNIQNGGAVPADPAASTAGPGGVPRYYVALKELPRKPGQPLIDAQDGIVVGDSLTGKTLATFSPPAHTTFQSVSAASDDETFVVFAVTSSDASFLGLKGAPLTGSWYELRLAPGTAHPARLSKLPVRPQSWANGNPGAPAPGEVFATALSGDGRELAVADVPDIPAAAIKTGNWHEVKVYSVATGRLLHDWTENNPAARLFTVLGSFFADVPVQSVLTWIDGDRALALATAYDKSNTVTGTVRRLDLAGPASGDLMKDSAVIWSGTLSWNDFTACYKVSGWPPLISADGKTITCLTIAMPYATAGHIDFGTVPLTPGTPAGVKPRIDYQVTIPPEKQTGGIAVGILWVSPSADKLIIQWQPGGNLSPHKQYLGVVSHGKFTPLRIPASLMTPTTGTLTF